MDRDLSSLLGLSRRGSSDSDLRLRLDSFFLRFSAFFDSLDRTFDESGVTSLSWLGGAGRCLLLEWEGSLVGVLSRSFEGSSTNSLLSCFGLSSSAGVGGSDAS